MWNNLAELFMNFIKTPISNDYLTFMLKKKSQDPNLGLDIYNI